MCFLSYRLDTETNGTEWKGLPGCQNVTCTECDFSSAITEYYDKYHVRIRAERREEVSPWSSTFEMIPYLIGMSSIYTVTLNVLQHIIVEKTCMGSIAHYNRSWWFSQP